MAEFIVVARATAKPGREADLEQALRALVPRTHEESGCVQYMLHRAVDDPRTFMTVERWRSKEAVDQHLAAPHVQALFQQLPDLIAGAPELTVFEWLPAGRSEKGWR